MEREITCNLCAVGTQLGEHNNNIHISFRDKTGDIHNQRNRIAQRSDKEPYEDETDTRK